MKAATIQLEALTCPSCIQKIEGAVKALGGIDKDTLKVLFNSSKVKVSYDDSKVTLSQIEGTITKMGYKVLKSSVSE